MRISIIAIAALLMTAPAIAKDADEAATRQDIQTRAAALLEKKNWATLNQMEERLRDGAEKTPSGEWKLRFFYIGLADFSYGRELTVDLAEKRAELAEEWAKEAPSPAAFIAQAKYLVDYGWMVRGEGPVSEVQPEQYRFFVDRLSDAYDVLMAHPDAKVDPQYYYVLLELTMPRSSWPKDYIAGLIEEASQKARYYPAIYDQLILRSEPRWGGTYEKVIKAAEFAAANTADKMGDEMFARVFWHVMLDGDDGRAAGGIYILNWNRARSGFRDMIGRYPTQWNINAFAYFSCLVHDPDAKELAQKVRAQIPSLWGNDPAAMFGTCKATGNRPM